MFNSIIGINEDALRKSAEMFVKYPFRLLDSSFDGSGRVLHLLCTKEGCYTDEFAAWIIRRPVLPGNDNLASMIFFTGHELDAEKAIGFFDDRVREALNRMESFEDGGPLPMNDPRYKEKHVSTV